MHTIQHNRRLSKPTNRLLFRYTNSSQHNAFHAAPKSRLCPPLSHCLPLFVTTDGNSRIDWTSRNALDPTFRPLRAVKDAAACTQAQQQPKTA